MKYQKTALFLLIIYSTVHISNGQEQNVEKRQQKLDAEVKEKIIGEIVGLLDENYVFPEVALQITENIQKQYEESAYDNITTIEEFIQKVTLDMQSINNDAHLGLVQRFGSFKEGVSMEDMYKSLLLKRMIFQNYGFKKVERLLGNVGCIVLDEFSYVEIDGENIGGETARSVMKQVINSYALIIDLRDNFGGREEMAMLLLEYFFKEPTHLLTNHKRGHQDNQIWTKEVNNKGNMAKIPIYILTSQHTVSGGEMFAYVLKNRNRATIIGQKTRGAAHKTHLFSLHSAEIDIAIPNSTTIDPVTGTDWEGKGVKPDIIVPSGIAMDVAYKMALEEIMQTEVDEMERPEMEWALMGAEANVNPNIPDESILGEYVGDFGDKVITLKNATLIYQSENDPVYELKPMSKDLFSFVDKGMFYVRIRFNRDKSGVIEALLMIFDTGQKREYTKTDNR